MRCTVLKPFPYAHDGIHIEELAKGDTLDILDDLLPGLIADGLVERAATEDPPAIVAAEATAARLAARAAVVIPEPLPTKVEDLRAIATQLTDEPVKSRDEALAVIEAERARRNPT